MAVYTDVSAEDLADFLHEYDLGELLSYKGIAEGVENSNFLVHTTRGHYILTLYEKRVREADLPFFLGLMGHLAGRGLTCPQPVRNRHGGALEKVQLDDEPLDLASPEADDKLLLIHEALDRLAAHDPRKAELVKQRYFVGLTLEEITTVMGISEATAKRDWSYARAWLMNEIKALLHQVHSNSAASGGGYPAAPRPPRTRRPPSAGGEQK